MESTTSCSASTKSPPRNSPGRDELTLAMRQGTAGAHVPWEGSGQLPPVPLEGEAEFAPIPAEWFEQPLIPSGLIPSEPAFTPRMAGANSPPAGMATADIPLANPQPWRTSPASGRRVCATCRSLGDANLQLQQARVQLAAMRRQNELLSAAKRQADQQGQHLRGQLSKVKEVLAERQSLRYELGQVCASSTPPLSAIVSSPRRPSPVLVHPHARRYLCF